ncbi:hypothetical protein BaRGS_00020266 [Batillaria attramentaria]|uniref:Uncharacterized protein n=1 Tax=Batillaria attramentaria TaxID=370345 RepID=A0ABD0KNI0_9CAEN
MNFRDSLLVTFLVAASFSLTIAEDCVVGSGSDCVGKPFCCFPSNCYCCASDTAGPNVTMVNQAVSSCVCDENNPGSYGLVIKSGGLVGNLKTLTGLIPCNPYRRNIRPRPVELAAGLRYATKASSTGRRSRQST